MGDSVSGEYNIGNAMTGLAQIGQMGIQNALTRQQMTQNALAIQNTRAQQAAGVDFQRAIDPNTGAFSPSKYNQLLAADPAAAFAASAASQAGVTNQGGVLGNQALQIKNKADQLGFLANLATGYAESPPTIKQAQSDLADGISQGLIDPSVGAQILSQAPTDPQAAQAWWKNEALHLSAAHGEVSRFLPQTQPIDIGSGTVMGQANPLAPGYTAPGTTVTMGLTPAQQTGTGSVTLPDGSTFQGTLPQIIAKLGGAVPQGAVAPPGAGPGTPIPNVPLGPGRIVPAPVAGGIPGQPAAIPAPAVPTQPGMQAAAQAPGSGITVPAGALDIAKNDTDYFTSALGNQQAAAATLPALRNVLAAAPGAQTGPAAADIASVSSALNEFGINVGNDQATQEQNLTKNGVQLVAALASKLGTPTDGKMMEAALGSPNANLTEGAIRTIGAEMTGTAALANATANALQEARAQGITPGTTAFAAMRSALNNPMLGTAFQYAYLDPAARGRVLDAMGGLKDAKGNPTPQAQQFLSALTFAYQLEPDLPSIRGQ